MLRTLLGSEATGLWVTRLLAHDSLLEHDAAGELTVTLEVLNWWPPGSWVLLFRPTVLDGPDDDHGSGGSAGAREGGASGGAREGGDASADARLPTAGAEPTATTTHASMSFELRAWDGAAGGRAWMLDLVQRPSADERERAPAAVEVWEDGERDDTSSATPAARVVAQLLRLPPLASLELGAHSMLVPRAAGGGNVGGACAPRAARVEYWMGRWPEDGTCALPLPASTADVAVPAATRAAVVDGWPARLLAAAPPPPSRGSHRAEETPSGASSASNSVGPLGEEELGTLFGRLLLPAPLCRGHVDLALDVC